MSLVGRHRELNAAFVNAGHPDLSNLIGEYLVNIVMVPGYSRFSHRKIFYEENDKIYGYNILFNKAWGHFRVEEGRAAVPDPLNVAVINYNRMKNSFVIRRIRDHIRRVKRDKLYIGRANYLLFGQLRFFGYFTLEKINQGS
jgi:hypothetical protein